MAATAERSAVGTHGEFAARGQSKATDKLGGKPKAGDRKKKATKSKSATIRTSTALPTNPVASLDAFRTERDVRKSVAAARGILERDAGNRAAKDALARAAVAVADMLLMAEAIGNGAKAERLGAFLVRDLSDSGARVRKLARQGDVKAKQALGVFYGRGMVLTLDRRRSCEEFQAASALPASAWHWAHCNMETAPEDAWASIERAASQGHATAQEWIGRRCLGEFATAGKDHACAREWLSQAASQGRSRAQTLYAYLLISGQGGPVDASRALRLYRLAADQGDLDAQNNLGEIHESGRGVDKNPAEALIWYERAAGRGFGPAQFNAGRLWAIGVGDQTDPAKARAWLVLAERNGIEQARQVMDWLNQRSN